LDRRQKELIPSIWKPFQNRRIDATHLNKNIFLFVFFICVTFLLVMIYYLCVFCFLLFIIYYLCVLFFVYY
jgi:Flp pilus assembly protein TadB